MKRTTWLQRMGERVRNGNPNRGECDVRPKADSSLVLQWDFWSCAYQVSCYLGNSWCRLGVGAIGGVAC